MQGKREPIHNHFILTSKKEGKISEPTHSHGVRHDDGRSEATLVDRRSHPRLESSEGERFRRRVPSAGENHGPYRAPSRRKVCSCAAPPALDSRQERSSHPEVREGQTAHGKAC